MGRTKPGKPRRPRPEPSEAPYLAFGLDGPTLALAWGTNADQVLADHTDKLVLVCPSKDEAQALLRDLATGKPWGSERAICPTEASVWRGSRSDHPTALLACIRYPGAETDASEDIIRYRSLMRAAGQPSVI
jgi:hypothetical protein